MQTPRLNVDITKMKDITCDSCGHTFFMPVVMFKVIPALLSPDGTESIAPITAYSCQSCGHVNDMFLPMSADEASEEQAQNNNDDAPQSNIIHLS